MSALFIPQQERDSMALKPLREEPAPYTGGQGDMGPPAYLADYGTPEEDTYL